MRLTLAVLLAPFVALAQADVPIVVEQTRRPVVAANPGPRGGWNMIALPIGDVDFEKSVFNP